LIIDEVAEPKVGRPSDVVVRIGGAGVCRTDLHILDGLWVDWVPDRPFAPGHENAGWVHEIGSEVDTVKVGDPVIVHTFATCGLCRACRAGEDQHCERQVAHGITTDGGFAELMLTTERALVNLERGLAPAAVAPLADAGVTAYHAVDKAMRKMRPGSTAVLLGAGGVGLAGLQCILARSVAKTIVVDPRPTARARAIDLGADHVLDAGEDQVNQVLALTAGLGAEVVFDFIGEFGSTAAGIAMTKRPGTYYCVGYGETITVPSMELIVKEVEIIGNTAGTQNDLADVIRMAEDDQVSLPSNRYPLEAVADALADLRAGMLDGRAVLVP
jgi:NAD+-dependent secondary alcohol dehydrogenase Adh1